MRTNLVLPRFGSRAVKKVLSFAGPKGIPGVAIVSSAYTIFRAIQSRSVWCGL